MDIEVEVEAFSRMEIETEDPREGSELPAAWKAKFEDMQPLVPAMFHVLPAIAMIMAACFGQPCFGTPWWSAFMFLVSGTSLFVLMQKRQTICWERWTYFAMILSFLVAVLDIILYCLDVALASSPTGPFSHRAFTNSQWVNHFHVTSAELSLAVFEVGMCGFILHILYESRKTLL